MPFGKSKVFEGIQKSPAIQNWHIQIKKDQLRDQCQVVLVYHILKVNKRFTAIVCRNDLCGKTGVANDPFADRNGYRIIIDQ